MPIRKATDLSLDASLLSEARELKLDVNRAAEEGIASAIKAEKARLWKIENADAIKASNDYVEKHGLPLARFRQF